MKGGLADKKDWKDLVKSGKIGWPKFRDAIATSLGESVVCVDLKDNIHAAIQASGRLGSPFGAIITGCLRWGGVWVKCGQCVCVKSVVLIDENLSC